MFQGQECPEGHLESPDVDGVHNPEGSSLGNSVSLGAGGDSFVDEWHNVGACAESVVDSNPDVDLAFDLVLE